MSTHYKHGIGDIHVSNERKTEVVRAMEQAYEAAIQWHKVNVENLIQNRVGVAEHPDLLETVEKELDKISEYHDRLEVIRKYLL